MKNKHLPQLDGLRGVAILIVLLGHIVVFSFGFAKFKYGAIPPIGVDLFFVLSGFLITSILLNAKGKPDFYKNFYARRSLRIWPLYILLLVFMFGYANHHIPYTDFDENRVHWQVFALYLQNIYYHTGAELGVLALAVTWSLAVEEQFYLIWPILVRKLSIRHMVYALGFIIAMAPPMRYLVESVGRDPYINPLCRFDSMAMGGLLAIWIAIRQPSRSAVLRSAAIMICAGALGELVGHVAHTTHFTSKSMVSLMFTGLLACALELPILIRLLSIPPLRYTGKISYCLYLSHTVIGPTVLYFLFGAGLSRSIVRSITVLACSYAFATASWYLFEQPILRLKRYFGETAKQAERREAPISVAQ